MYAVIWETTGGNNKRAVRPSHEDAKRLQAKLLTDPQIVSARLYKCGRNDDTDTFSTREGRSTEVKKYTRSAELIVSSAHWQLPVGYVDPEADKHGPRIDYTPNYHYTKTDQEKAEWFKTYKPTNKTSLWH